MTGKSLIQFLQALFRERGYFPAFRDQHVRCQDARTACVRDNGQTRAFRARLFAQNFRHIKEVLDRPDSQNPNAAKRGIEHSIITRKTPGMRDHRFGSCFRASRFDDNNRFSESDLASSRKKRSGISDRFHVNENALACENHLPNNQ